MSTQILPKNPANTTMINSLANENIRLSFLTRFINSPCLISVALCIKDYVQSGMVTGTYQYQYISKKFKKNGTVNDFSGAELFLLIANYESASFCRDCVGIIISDIEFNITAQETIENDVNSTEQEVNDALEAKWKFMSMLTNLQNYKKEFLTYSCVNGELMEILKVMLAVAE